VDQSATSRTSILSAQRGSITAGEMAFGAVRKLRADDITRKVGLQR